MVLMVAGTACAGGGPDDGTDGPARGTDEVAEASDENTGVESVEPAIVTTTTTLAPTTTIPTTTTVVTPRRPPEMLFFEDFEDPSSLAALDAAVYHRDDHLVASLAWEGDHPIAGPDDQCGPAEEKRFITRGLREEGFNDDWIYRCASDGDLIDAHLMTSIGDTSGYSIGAFSPAQIFENVTEVSWDVNITYLGARQFTEVLIIPVENFDLEGLPCIMEWLPCETPTMADVGAVGASFMNHELHISDSGDRERHWATWGTEDLNYDDEALTSVGILRKHFIRDNGDGTVVFGIQQPDDSFFEFTHTGSFPEGPVRVAFTDHNHTPDKDEPPIGHTWHWDNLTVIG